MSYPQSWGQPALAPPKRDLPPWAVGVVVAVFAAVMLVAAFGPKRGAVTATVPPSMPAPTAPLELPDEARVMALLEACTPGSARCFSEALAGATGESAATLERARAACRTHYQAALDYSPASLERQTSEALDGIRRNAFCLRALGGNPAFTIVDVDRAHAIASQRAVIADYRGGVEGWGGGYSRGGRCRDSRGRFRTCR